MKKLIQNTWFRTFMYGLLIGVLSAAVIVIDQLFQMGIKNLNGSHLYLGKSFAYIAFIGWPLFYLGGSNKEGTIKAIISTVLGITAAILMNLFSGWFGTLGFMAVPLGVGLVATPVMLLGKNKWTSYIPALFATCGVFFATFGVTDASFTFNDYLLVGAVELPFILLGFSMGALSIVGQNLGNKWWPKTKKEDKID